MSQTTTRNENAITTKSWWRLLFDFFRPGGLRDLAQEVNAL